MLLMMKDEYDAGEVGTVVILEREWMMNTQDMTKILIHST